MDAELIKVSNDSLEDMIDSALRVFPRVKFDRELEEDQKRLFEKCLRCGEFSVFTHAFATIEFTCSLGVCRELRSRNFNITQTSHIDTEKLEFSIPSSICDNEELSCMIRKLFSRISKIFKDLKSLGLEENQYSLILPEATVTTVLVSANFYEWLRILKLERYTHISEELKEICSNFYKVLNDECPQVFNRGNLKLRLN